MMESRMVKKHKRKPKWKRIVLVTLFTLLIGGGLFVYNVWGNVANAVDKMSASFDRGKSDKREEIVKFKEKDPISVLLVGVDEERMIQDEQIQC